MKLSLATSSVLLYAGTVQALPPAPPNNTTTRPWWKPTITPTSVNPIRTFSPVPQTTEPLQARAEYSSAVPVADPSLGEDIAAQLSALIQAAKVPGDDWEEKQKVLKNLEDSRKATIERLLDAQTAQQSAEVHLNTEQNRLDNAQKKTTRVRQGLDGLKKEKVELEKRINSTVADLGEAKWSQLQVKRQVFKALGARRDAADEVKKLREAIEKIDEAIKNIGVPKN